MWFIGCPTQWPGLFTNFNHVNKHAKHEASNMPKFYNQDRASIDRWLSIVDRWSDRINAICYIPKPPSRQEKCVIVSIGLALSRNKPQMNQTTWQRLPKTNGPINGLESAYRLSSSMHNKTSQIVRWIIQFGLRHRTDISVFKISFVSRGPLLNLWPTDKRENKRANLFLVGQQNVY